MAEGEGIGGMAIVETRWALARNQRRPVGAHSDASSKCGQCWWNGGTTEVPVLGGEYLKGRVNCNAQKLGNTRSCYLQALYYIFGPFDSNCDMGTKSTAKKKRFEHGL